MSDIHVLIFITDGGPEHRFVMFNGAKTELTEAPSFSFAYHTLWMEPLRKHFKEAEGEAWIEMTADQIAEVEAYCEGYDYPPPPIADRPMMTADGIWLGWLPADTPNAIECKMAAPNNANTWRWSAEKDTWYRPMGVDINGKWVADNWENIDQEVDTTPPVEPEGDLATPAEAEDWTWDGIDNVWVDDRPAEAQRIAGVQRIMEAVGETRHEIQSTAAIQPFIYGRKRIEAHLIQEAAYDVVIDDFPFIKEDLAFEQALNADATLQDCVEAILGRGRAADLRLAETERLRREAQAAMLTAANREEIDAIIEALKDNLASV